jgi:pyrroloquinoline quinone (PQQ) biosynthesis protein C
MNREFVREGDIRDLSSYPSWVGDLVERCAEAREAVVQHELFQRMRDVRLSRDATHRFLVGVWPTIVQFPQYMALNLVKVQYGSSRGHDLARRFLIRNIRVEQSHADMWLDWAQACGVSRQEVVEGSPPAATPVLAHWCWSVCSSDGLAPAIAATNYAIEGATGDWAALVCSRDDYALSFPEDQRKPAMRWLRQHARYDDVHPWEALEIIASLLGQQNPGSRVVARLEQCVRTSYEYMCGTLDDCLIGAAAPQRQWLAEEA